MEPEEEPAKAEGVDVDLTVLSSTMVYSEVYNMMIAPDNFKGKVIRMKGQYDTFFDERTGNRYFSCFISDATACCSQGIEFVLTDDYSFPEDYPTEGDTICVQGTFDTYIEGGEHVLHAERCKFGAVGVTRKRQKKTGLLTQPLL